jgi:hypothetical protein
MTMKEHANDPVLSFEDFLRKSMGSEADAGFADFLSLWQFSDSLRLRIRQFVEHATNDDENWHKPKSVNEETAAPKSSSQDGPPNFGPLPVCDVEKRLGQSYGGLSRRELLVLLEKYKAGNRDIGAYLFVRGWKQHAAGTAQSSDPVLKRLTLDCVSQAITQNRVDFFRQIADTLEFLEGEEFQTNGQWDHDPGQWWQFHLLLYVLEHPKEKYRTREFIRYFEAEVGANAMPTAKTLRAFCHSVGIALDSTPGAPRKQALRPKQ